MPTNDARILILFLSLLPCLYEAILCAHTHTHNHFLPERSKRFNIGSFNATEDIGVPLVLMHPATDVFSGHIVVEKAFSGEGRVLLAAQNNRSSNRCRGNVSGDRERQ